MSGPFPKPTAVKVAEGNPGKKKLPAKEPKPKTPASLQPPAYLSAAAVAVWGELVSEYRAMGLLSAVDVPKFAMYCDAVADYQRLTVEIQLEGEVITSFNKAGQPYALQSPKVAIRHQAWVRLAKLGAELGDSPGSRARFGKLLDEEEEDEFDQLCGGKPKDE